MADVFSRKKRSNVMALIRARDTLPEIDVRRFLWSRGFRYRLHVSRLPGRPDIYLKKFRAAILVNGCFWHQHRNCRFAVMPKSNIEFWERKLRGNVQRDCNVGEQLLQAGIRVMHPCYDSMGVLARNWETRPNVQSFGALASLAKKTCGDLMVIEVRDAKYR